MSLEFQTPAALWLLLLLPAYAFLRWRAGRGVSLRFSGIAPVRTLPRTRRLLLRRVPEWLRLITLGLIVIALARPRQGLTETWLSSEGVDIVIALDVSGSMEASDFTAGDRSVTRLDISKQVIEQFIRGRRSDRIGLVVFATFAYTQCPLTVDYPVLEELLGEVQLGMLDGSSTAIGYALMASLARLKYSPAESKVIVLLTDGNSNAGKINPETAAEMAETLGVKIYAIGVGGAEPFRYRGRMGRIYTVEPLNDEPLKEMAEVTGGKYFRATDSNALESIFATIDRLEKTESEAVVYTQYRELFPYALGPALALFLLALLLEKTAFRRLP